MAKRRPARVSKLEQAKRVIRSTVSSGRNRANSVHAAVRARGISTRTYRTARKQMGTAAIRRSRKQGKRGKGTWYVGL